jgi:hypothetical protein
MDAAGSLPDALGTVETSDPSRVWVRSRGGLRAAPETSSRAAGGAGDDDARPEAHDASPPGRAAPRARRRPHGALCGSPRLPLCRTTPCPEAHVRSLARGETQVAANDAPRARTGGADGRNAPDHVREVVRVLEPAAGASASQALRGSGERDERRAEEHGDNGALHSKKRIAGRPAARAPSERPESNSREVTPKPVLVLLGGRVRLEPRLGAARRALAEAAFVQQASSRHGHCDALLADPRCHAERDGAGGPLSSPAFCAGGCLPLLKAAVISRLGVGGSPTASTVIAWMAAGWGRAMNTRASPLVLC